MIKRFRSAEWFLVVSLVAVALYGVLIVTVPSLTNWSHSTWMSIRDLSLRHGYTGTFVASILANATIVIPIPYTALVLIVAAAGVNPWLLGLVSGLGAGIGEVTSYLAGYLGSRLGRRMVEHKTEAVRHLMTHRPGYMFFFLFLVGATPLPDDLFMIPLGIIRYPILRAMLPFMLGKVFITTAIALTGTLPNVENFLEGTGSENHFATLATLASTMIVIYAILKIDWNGIGKRFLDKQPQS